MTQETTVSVYLEPTKRKLMLDLGPDATVGEVVQGMVAHLQMQDGFDVQTFLREKIGDGYAADWQLFRERENMQLLPPTARFSELESPVEVDELFTMKINAKVASFPITQPPPPSSPSFAAVQMAIAAMKQWMVVHQLAPLGGTGSKDGTLVLHPGIPKERRDEIEPLIPAEIEGFPVHPMYF